MLQALRALSERCRLYLPSVSLPLSHLPTFPSPSLRPSPSRFPSPSRHRIVSCLSHDLAVLLQASKAKHAQMYSNYPAADNYDEDAAAHAFACYEHPENCNTQGRTNEDAEARRTRIRQGIAAGYLREHRENEADVTGSWHTEGTEDIHRQWTDATGTWHPVGSLDEARRRAAHVPVHHAQASDRVRNASMSQGHEDDGEEVTVKGEEIDGYGEDDEPWEIRGAVSSTDHGQKHWQPHYFNHAFWSQLYHYFKGDKPSEYCNVCVGEFMTALQDIKDPHTGIARKTRAEQVCASEVKIQF